ncbi:MAG: hypothetical protein HY289_03225 [Planctomycetes bacterium]|nr:hypothetical protein [Planctomycetota bacterium]
MAIRMTCPECEASLSLADDKRGKKVRCKECENVLTVPSANGKLKSAEVDEGESPTPDKKKKKKKKKSSDFPVVWIAVAAAVVVVLAIGGSVTAYFVTRPPAPPPQAKVDPPPPRDNRPAAVVKNPKSLLGQIRARGDQAARDAEMVGIVTLYHAYHDEVKNPTARGRDYFGRRRRLRKRAVRSRLLLFPRQQPVGIPDRPGDDRRRTRSSAGETGVNAMKRYYVMLVLFSTCLVFAGCSRGAREPRKPIFTEIETDILKGKREEAVLFSVRPLDRKYRIYIDVAEQQCNPFRTSIYTVDEKIDGKEPDKSAAKVLLKAAVLNQVAMETAKDNSKAVMAARASADAEEEVIEFKAVAKRAMEYYQSKNDPAKHYTELEFYKFVRRGDWFWERKFWDKVQGEITSEKVLLIEPIGRSSITFATAVDFTQPYQVLAYRKDAKGGGGTVVWNRSWKVDEAKWIQEPIESISGLTNQLRKQELRIIRKHFLQFAAPLLLRGPADEEETKTMKKFIARSYDDLLQQMCPLPEDKGDRYWNPRDVLLNVDRVLLGLGKDPPEPRDRAKFDKLLKEKCPPSVVDSLEDRVIAINFKVDLRMLLKDIYPQQPPNQRNRVGEKPEIIACFTEPDFDVNPDTQAKTFKGYYSILADGSVDPYVQKSDVDRFLPKEPPIKRDKVNPMAAGGGGPGALIAGP